MTTYLILLACALLLLLCLTIGRGWAWRDGYEEGNADAGCHFCGECARLPQNRDHSDTDWHDRKPDP